MAISLITAAATTLTDGASDPGLISQLNTALAPLLSDNIRGVSFITQGDDRLIGNELQVAITYDTVGSVIANPFVAVGFQAKSIDSLKTLMLAFLAAHPSYFFSTAWIQPIPMQRQGSQYVGLMFYNVNSAQGAANWAVNGGGTAQPFALTVVTLVDAATINTDASLGNLFDITLGGNHTFAAPTNASAGDRITYRIRQGLGGSHVPVWDPIFRYSSTSPAPTLSVTAGKTDYVTYLYNEVDVKWDGLAANVGFGP